MAYDDLSYEHPPLMILTFWKNSLMILHLNNNLNNLLINVISLLFFSLYDLNQFLIIRLCKIMEKRETFLEMHFFWCS